MIPSKFGATANLTSVSVTRKLQSTLNESRSIYFHPLSLFLLSSSCLARKASFFKCVTLCATFVPTEHYIFHQVCNTIV